MLELHPSSGFGDTCRFIHLQGQGLCGAHSAKFASSSAVIPRDHKRRSALAPTLELVGAFGTFANRMQLQIIQQSPRS